MILPALFFYLFAGVCVASAFMVIAAKNPVHSVLFLILAFVNAAGLFVLMGAEFLAMILIVVYVGAVAVLFLFVVMMLDVDFAELRQGFLQYLPVGALVGVVFLVELLLVVGAWAIGPGMPQAISAPIPADDHQHRGARPRALHALRLLLPGRRPGAAGRHDRRHRADACATSRASSARTSPIRSRARKDTAIEVRPGPVGAGHLTMTIGLGHYLTVAAILFTLGIFGIFLNRKNVIIILMSIELILLAVNINFVAFSTHLGDIVGPGVRAARADGRGRRGRDRPCHPRRLFPQPRLDRGRRHQPDEGLRCIRRSSFCRCSAPSSAASFRWPARARDSRRRARRTTIIMRRRMARPRHRPCSGRARRHPPCDARGSRAGRACGRRLPRGRDHHHVAPDDRLRAVLDRVLAGRLRPRGPAHRRCSPGSSRRDLKVDWALRIDTLTAVMLVVVTTVSALVHLYSIGYMARGPVPAAVLRLPVAVHLRHAGAGDGRQPRAAVLRLGGRRPRELSADRLLVSQARGQRRRDQGLRRQPRRRFRLRARHLRASS